MSILPVLLLPLNAGCIMWDVAEGGVYCFEAYNPSDVKVVPFVVIWYQLTQKPHWFEDPDERPWFRRPTDLVFVGNGEECLEEESFGRNTFVGLIPMFGIISRQDFDWDVYAAGYEISRQAARGYARLPQGNSQRSEWVLVHVLEKPTNRLGIELSRCAAGRVVEDLQNDQLWRYLQKRWRDGKDIEAVRYLCRYYIRRFEAIRAANTDWVPSEAVLERARWMRAVLESVAPGRGQSGMAPGTPNWLALVGQPSLHHDREHGQVATRKVSQPVLARLSKDARRDWSTLLHPTQQVR